MGERRSSVRVPLGVYASEAVGDDLLRAFATDVSPAGIYLERAPVPAERLFHKWEERVQIEVPLPGLDETIWAGRGLGCWLNGLPCSVNDRSTIQGGVLSTSGFDYWEPEMLSGARASGMQMRTWGDGYGYLLVASGRIEAMVDPTINFWDIAPCLVIIPEAGGTLSRADGATDVELTSCVATNGVLHDQVIAALNAS